MPRESEHRPVAEDHRLRGRLLAHFSPTVWVLQRHSAVGNLEHEVRADDRNDQRHAVQGSTEAADLSLRLSARSPTTEAGVLAMDEVAQVWHRRPGDALQPEGRGGLARRSGHWAG